MAPPQARPHESSTEAPPTDSRRQGDPPISEDLLIRNYDVEHPYTVHVQIEGRDSDMTFEWTYYLEPGEFRSEIGVLDPGTYSVTVTTETAGREKRICEVGPDHQGTILVETGNYVVAVSEGMG